MSLKEYFKFDERKTNYSTEIIAGLTTFLTMAYIVVVNPSILGKTGLEFEGVFIATIIVTILGTLFMGVFANYPIAIAPGMGMNAYFTFVVCISMGIPWQQALAAVFVSAVIFLLLSLTNFRQAVINAIPTYMKDGITAGIGLFISFIGLQLSHIIVDSPATLVTLGKLSDPVTYMSLLGLFISIVLVVNNVRGALFIGMIITAIISYLFGFIVLPEHIFALPTMGHTAFQLDFSNILSPAMITVIFTFFIVTLFDTTGTMLGIAKQANLMKGDTFPNVKPALLADAVASLVGSLLGTSPTSAYVESGAGVAAGGRTGFVGVVVSVMMALMLFTLPLAKVLADIPAITAPPLIIVGFYMMTSLARVNWTDVQEAFPAFLIVLTMPLSYSITDGVGIGIITYVLIKIVSFKFKHVHPLMYIFGLLFLVDFLFAR